VPVTKGQKSARGIPRKTRNSMRKNRHARYWQRATCTKCNLVFRSPKKKKRHVDSGHGNNAGLRRDHIGVQAARMKEIMGELDKAL